MAFRFIHKTGRGRRATISLWKHTDVFRMPGNWANATRSAILGTHPLCSILGATHHTWLRLTIGRHLADRTGVAECRNFSTLLTIGFADIPHYCITVVGRGSKDGLYDVVPAHGRHVVQWTGRWRGKGFDRVIEIPDENLYFRDDEVHQQG